MRAKMRPRVPHICRAIGILALALAPVARATAQTADASEMTLSEGRFAVGGEVSAIVSPPDQVDFFNYTDYDENALRVTQIRLFGEWRLSTRVSIVGELRTENTDAILAPGLYLRWQPVANRKWFVQAGRIPPVIGSFTRRAYDRDNAVIGQPLAYQYLTTLRPDALPATTDNLLQMRGRGWQPSYPIGSNAVSAGIPLVSVSRWDTGVETSWTHDWLDVAAALTQGSPAIPVVRDTNHGLMASGRVAGQWKSGLTLGVSAARGEWIDDSALALTPGGTNSPASESILGADAEFGRGPWLIRSEWLRAGFQVPFADDPAAPSELYAWSGFVEARYRFRPRWEVGARIDGLRFSTIQSAADPSVVLPWDAPVDRVEATLDVRLTRRLEVRGGWQQDWRFTTPTVRRGYPVASVLYWF